MNNAPSNEGDSKLLIPRWAPGRITRKARAYSLEIMRLRRLDYTLDAIREALADAGVNVSISTVRREVKRQEAGPPSAIPS